MDWFNLVSIIGLVFALAAMFMAANNTMDFFISRACLYFLTFLVISNFAYKNWQLHGTVSAILFFAAFICALLYGALFWIDKKQYGSCAYLKVLEKDLANKVNPLPIWIDATGTIEDVEYWIWPGHVKSHEEPDYWSITAQRAWARSFKTLHKDGGRLVGGAIGRGSYRVSFTTKNGGLRQEWRIIEYNGKLIQLIDVFNTKDRLLYSSSRPKGFVE